MEKRRVIRYSALGAAFFSTICSIGTIDIDDCKRVYENIKEYKLVEEDWKTIVPPSVALVSWGVLGASFYKPKREYAERRRVLEGINSTRI